MSTRLGRLLLVLLLAVLPNLQPVSASPLASLPDDPASEAQGSVSQGTCDGSPDGFGPPESVNCVRQQSQFASFLPLIVLQSQAPGPVASLPTPSSNLDGNGNSTVT